jgi:hypothetical protein
MTLVLLTALALTVTALQNPRPNPQQTGSRNAGVKPKRPSPRRDARGNIKAGANQAAAGVVTNSLSPVLATADFDLLGLAVVVDPVSLTVPKNTPTSIHTSIRVPEGTDPSALIAALNPNYRVRGELTGPSLTGPLTLEASIGQPLNIPALSNAGDHLIRNLRVIDLGTPDQAVVTTVTPDSIGIVVIERLLVSQVEVHELTYDQILQAGINITDDSYRAFNFTLGIGTSSTAETISIPVAFPTVGVEDSRPLIGVPSVSSPGVDVPTIYPVMLSPEGPDGDPSGTPQGAGEALPKIPGVIVFPGRVGLLHQFFEAIVIVGNGAPNGSPLVIHSLRARAKLPDNGTPADASDDPLRIADTQNGGRVSELDLHGLGPDGRYGTGDDTTTFGPGGSGQATFLLEGLKEGLHPISFDLEAMLEGLPSGPVKVTGEVPGAVLVRDASFAVTFTHPSVVRAGNEYDLGMTIYNSGQTNINGAFAQLPPNGISGAEFAGQDTGRRDFATTIKRGESATVKWRLRANVTGAVTASYVKVGEGVSAGLALVTGVGDRNIPLSPDSLILPEPVRHLPPPVVEAARALLGQAWSIANAPPGSLPQGVTTVNKQTVVDRAVELGIAGMRVDFGEPVSVSLDTVMRDWLGELQESPDPGFADTQRNTRSGFEWFDSVGTEFFQRLNAGASAISALDLHQEFANTELPRSQFISALVTHANGEALVGARFVNAHEEQVGFGPSETERSGDFARGSSLRLSQTDVITGAVTNGGQMLVVSDQGSANPGSSKWTLELNGWRTGTIDLSLVAPADSQAYRLYSWSGFQITAGVKYRVRFMPLSLTTLTIEEYRDGSWQTTNATANATTLNQPAPHVVGVIQVTPSVVAGGDKYGRLVGVLFSKPMAQGPAQTLTRYTIGGGVLKNSNPAQLVGEPIGVKGARIDYGDRFVFMSLNSTVGPYIDRDLSIASMVDARGLTLAATTRSIVTRVSPEGIPPGGYLTGRVLNADGTPVVNAPVITWVQECPDPTALFPPPPTPIVVKYTNAQGRYEIDYVRDGDCGPLNVSVNNPTTHSEKRLTSPVAYDGQHMVLDMVFLARGIVQGYVTMNSQPMPLAFVRVVPDLDVVGTKVVQADANGHYLAEDVPVGNVSVLAVGAGAAHNASGFNAGTIPGPGLSGYVNVSLQNISGVVRGRVVHGDQTPAPGSLIVAYAVIPGFHSLRGDGATAVGYAFADRDGSFAISNLPVSDVKLEVTDYVTGLITQQSVQLTGAVPEVNGLLITLPGFGSVSGRVTDDTGTPLPGVFVSSSGRGTQTDFLGNYTLQSLPAGMKTITAYDEVTQRSGSAQAPVSIGQTTSGINIVILRPSILRGTVYEVKEGTSTPVPAVGVKVSANGFRIVETNAQGQYTITGVESGDLLMRFVDTEKQYAVNTPIKLLPGETLTKDATFRPGTIHGKVFQPDGVTPTIAQLTVYVSRPEPTIGFGWGLLSTDPPLSTQSAADGSYSLSGLNPGTYRITTSNVFFPTRVSAGGTLQPGGNAETNLVLVSTLAGKIQGNVYQPDGTTLVGPGIRVTLSGGSLADVTVRTDENGHYEFAEVFSAGGYSLTASDPVTGNVNRIGISVERNKDAVFDLRLLGSGTLRVQVLDGAGQPATGGTVTVDGTEYPNAHRFAEVPLGSNGQVSFSNLPEGSYAISATRFGLGGRVSARLAINSTVDVSVQLQATGNVEGHVFLPDGTTAISLADVQLSVGGRSVGFTVTSEEPDLGKFSFINVPTGDFTLDAFDNHTGRVGRAAGSITTQGETVVVNVLLLPIGAVAGQVTANGAGVDHASVRISADGSGVRGANLFATTDPTGHFRFTGIPAGRFVISVADAPGGQTGSASGTISGTVEPLPDTIVNIALEPSQSVNGTVFQRGGTERVPGAQVTITAGNRVFHTATNDQGNYSLGFVPLGQVYVRAEAPVGYDRGDATPVSGKQAGATITVNVTLAGVGSIAGQALDNNGAPLSAGTVTFTNDAWSPPIVLYASVQPDGSYEIPGAPAGHFSLRLTVPGRVGVGSASGDVLAGQTLNVPLQLEDAGTVTGRANAFDGTTPVQGASVSVTLFRPAGSLTFYTHTNAQGLWTLNNVPLGTLDILVSDEVSGGVARARSIALATNGQTVNVGTMVLDNTPISVVSVQPANGAQSLPTNGTVITVTFSEPAEPSTVNSGTVQLQQGFAGIGTTLSLSGDGRVATLTPVNRLVENAVYKVVVNQIEDRAGLRIATAFNSTFTTADETAPVVSTIVPANNAGEFPLNGSIAITFNEPIDSGNLASIVYLAPLNSPQATVTGNAALDATGRILTFTPAASLADSTRYVITVNGQRDATGNTQAQALVSNFSSHDQTAPVVDPLPIDGTTAQNVRPTITGTYNDNFSGVKTSTVVLTIDGVNVTPSASVTATQISYTPSVSLALGQHTVTLQVADNGGNVSTLRNATFSIVDTTPPSVTTITPTQNATEVPATASVVVSFSEPLDPAVNLAGVVKVAANQSPATPLAGSYQLDAAGSVVTFLPAGGFADSTQFTITVNGARDVSGNVQTQAFVSTFATRDLTPPIIDPLPIDGTTVRVYRPTITATYHDSPSGIKTSTLLLTVDNVNVTQNATVTGSQVNYTPVAPLNAGHHTVTVQVADNAGNVSALRTASFDIDDSGPVISSFTIGGTPAVDGMIVASSLQPVFAISYTDDTGINVSATQLLFAAQGSPLAQVPATVTQTGLTYQPPGLLAEGQYSVKAIITNNLGTSSTTGVINFTLDVDAPEITSVTPSTGNQHGGTTVTLTGARLLNTTGTAPTVTIAGNTAQVKTAVAGSPDVVTIITPAGPPGPATIRISTNRGTGVLINGFTYQADPRTPFITEADTALLWHMDEQGNGGIRITDTGISKSIHGTASSNSQEQPGRFMRGRSRAGITGDPDNGALYFGSSGYTVEFWMKTDPVTNAYTLAGKDGSDGYYYSTEYAVRLLPSGVLRAITHDQANRTPWKADLPRSVYQVDDNQWHYVAMVVDRTANRLSLYVDGSERIGAPMPAGYGVQANAGQRFNAGHYDFYDGWVGGAQEFTGVLDEIRVSNTAHSAATIQKTYLGTEGALGLVITNNASTIVGRGETTTLQLNGYNLAGISASVNSATPDQFTTQVLASAATQARVQVTVGANAALGDSSLVISSSAGSATVTLKVIDLTNVTLLPDADTRVLWHLDETNNGAVRINDASSVMLLGTASNNSTAAPGRFSGGRTRADMFSDNDAKGVLNFTNSNYTVEFWMKTDPIINPQTLVGKDSSDGYYYNTDWAVRLMPNGLLRVLLQDTNRNPWKAELQPYVYRVDDNQWHYVAMVVNRTTNRLSLYVDGYERAFSASPAGFGTQLNAGQPLRAGHYSYYDGWFGGITEFPGTLDEIRISATAHTAEHILNDATGNTPLTVTSYDPKQWLRDQAGGQTLVASMTISGYNLDGITAQVLQNGQPINATATVTSSTARQAQINVAVGPNAPLGASQLVISKPGQADVTLNARIGALAEHVGDNDTIVLWHMNETANGLITIVDEGPLGINGTSASASTAQPGHYGLGRQNAGIFSGPDYGALTMSVNPAGFTAEVWMKTSPLTNAYTLVGKQDDGGYYYNTDFALRLLPSGALRAYVIDTGKNQWLTQVVPLTHEFDDNQWHYMALVCDRTANKLSIYVDGVERASTPAPAGFGAVQNAGQPLRAGHYAYYDGWSGGSANFPGIIDEVRVSTSPHSAERIARDMDAPPGLRIASYTPREIIRGNPGTPLNTAVNLTGWGLDNVTAAVLQNGQPISVTASVVSSAFRQAQVNLSVPSTAPLGIAQLVISKPGLPDAAVELQINQQAELAYDLDTRVLWHLNETANGQITIVDDTQLGLNGTSSSNSLAQVGHIGNGRSKAGVFSAPDFGALTLGSSSFTAEVWMKTGQLTNAYTLIGKQDDGGYYYNTDFALRLLPSGALRAYVIDTGKNQWLAQTVGRVYDRTTGRWQLVVDNNEWHHVAMVCDRTANKLTIYVDGIERASAPTPAGFGPTQNAGQPLRVGHYAYYDGWSGGSADFPGVLDEARLSTTAHTRDQIVAAMQGTDINRVTAIAPWFIQRGSGPVAVTISGYGLSGATITADQPDASVTVTSTSISRLNCTVNVPATVPVGQLHFTITNTNAESFPAELTIIDHQPFTNAAGTDAMVLWHLDETGNGAVPIVGSGDAVPTVIGGTASSNSTAQPGHFANGRVRSGILGAAAGNSLNFGSNSFTAEAWMKSGPFTNAYTLIGKQDDGGYYYNTDFALRVLPSGGVRAYVIDTGKNQWLAQMAPRTYDPATGRWQVTLNDNQWHHVAMVCDRVANKLIIYVDGIERANAAMPAGFGPMQNAAQPIRAGHYAYYDGWSGGSVEFTGTLDEVRVLNYARSAAQMHDVWYGTTTAGGAAPAALPTPEKLIEPEQPQIQITSAAPTLLTRDRNAKTALVTNLTVAGANLSGVKGLVLRDGQPLAGVVVNAQDSTDAGAHLAVAVAPTTPLGPAQLVLSKPGHKDAAVEVRIAEPSEFALEADTVGLWHLDEPDEGVAQLLDASEHGINLTSVISSRAAQGRFGGGRTSSRATADANHQALALGASSFTVEGWVKSPALERDYVLIGKETNSGQNTDFTLKALSSGALRAEIYDASGLAWQVESLPGTVNLTDGQWHAVALVVDREAGLLSLYVDGQIRIVVPAPLGFGALRNLGQPLEFGCFDADAVAASGSEEFPGVLDEIRISATAHDATKIDADFFGHDEPQVVLVRPDVVRKGIGPVGVTLSGYGLAGASVQANQPGVKVAVISSTSNSIKLSVDLSTAAANGPVKLTVTDVLGRATIIELNVVDGPIASRIGNSANEESRRADLLLTPNRIKRAAGASSRISRASQDAKPVGGQR